MPARPSGIVRIVETSRSPKTVIATVRGIGVAVSTRACGRGALRAQRLALLDPEPVLLVDDDETEVGEGRRVAEQRVGADDDPRLPGCRPQRRLAPLGGRHLTGEQRGHELGGELRPQHPRDRSQVLTGEHLGRGDEGRLAAALGDLEHRPQGHERLARADLALHEPVHRPVALQIAADLIADRDLVGGARERQGLVEPGQQVARLAPRRRQRAHELPLLQECDLQHERLVHAQRAARLIDLLFEIGPVDALDRGPRVEQPVGGAQVVGKRIRRPVRGRPARGRRSSAAASSRSCSWPGRSGSGGSRSPPRSDAPSPRRRTARSRDARAASTRGTPPPCRRRRRVARAAGPSCATPG